MTDSELGDSELPRADERWRLATHERLGHETTPLLAAALKQLELLRADPMLPQPLRADARLIAISVAESAVLLECLLEALADQPAAAATRRPVRLEARKRFLERAMGEATGGQDVADGAVCT